MSYVTYECGCVNDAGHPSGIMRNVSKCSYHLSYSGKTGLAHYEDMGVLVKGAPQHFRYEAELTQALDEMGVAIAYGQASEAPMALEVGCGLANYAPMLLKRGLGYLGVEPDPEAALWAMGFLGPCILNRKWEDVIVPDGFRVVLAAHVFEHLEDAPAGIAKCYEALERGGRLILIVPNDDDPVNPDHLWFFTQASLKATLQRIGFEDIRMVEIRRVKHEKFIYATAVRWR